MLRRRTLLKGSPRPPRPAYSPAAGIAADTPLKMGFSMPLTGAGFPPSAGKLTAARSRSIWQQHGDTVAGRKIELIIRDDGGVADNARRIVQEMIVNDKVDIVGVGITPCRWRSRSSSPRPKRRRSCMSSGASITTTKSPYFVRAGFIIAPQAWIFAEWAIKNGTKRVVTLVNEWAPGNEAETAFKTRFTQVGGEILESLRIPLASPDFAPSLQRSPISSRIPPSSISRGRWRRSSPGNSREGPRPIRHQDHRSGRSLRRRQPQ